MIEVDLRVRYRKRLGLISLKTSDHLTKAESNKEWGKHLNDMRELAGAGSWRETMAGKNSFAKLYGGLAVSFKKNALRPGRWPKGETKGGSWRLKLFHRRNKKEIKPGHFQGRIRASGSARRKTGTKPEASEAQGEAKDQPAPKRPRLEKELYHHWDSEDSETDNDDA